MSSRCAVVAMTDRTKAVALELAERRLVKLGWRFSHEDIGVMAAQIIIAMEKALQEAQSDTSTDKGGEDD